MGKRVIRTYRNASGRDDVAQWFGNLTAKEQAKVLVRIEYLRAQPREKWGMPHFRRLRGEGAGLGEFRFTLARVENRPIGYFGPNEDLDFTILITAIEKGGKFIPSTACAVAQRRKNEIEQNPTQAGIWIHD